jgi:hypothetical protein
MTDINVKIRSDRSKQDLSKLRMVLNEMKRFETTTKDTEEGKRKVQEELRRRLIEAGLRVE